MMVLVVEGMFGPGNHKWIEVFELEEGFDPKLLESKKRHLPARRLPT